MKPLFFVDLDDSLFQTLLKDGTASIPAAVDREGNALSFMTERQQALFEWICASSEQVVPITGRNKDALDRVTLPVFYRLAVTSHGGAIWIDGKLDAEWASQMAAGAERESAALDHLLREAQALPERLGLNVRATIVSDGQRPLYLSVKHNAKDAAETKAAWVALEPHLPEGWHGHLNAHNCAALPPHVSKAHAAQFVIEHRVDSAPAFVLGLGDSLSDLGFMGLADLALTPPRSQIFRAAKEARP